MKDEELKDMPVVTVEQIARFRAAALEQNARDAARIAELEGMVTSLHNALNSECALWATGPNKDAPLLEQTRTTEIAEKMHEQSTLIKELERQVAVLQDALKPGYVFYMIEWPGRGWLSGGFGEHEWTHSAEEAITFYDKHSAELIMKMLHCGYGAFVTEHVWCTAPSATQSTERR